ncbi:MAG: hypothetical protein J1F35_06450 [Erysipelotrichales bacterium]|nr:hypothetical protein [Erysipelotrichales bacterium]
MKYIKSFLFIILIFFIYGCKSSNPTPIEPKSEIFSSQMMNAFEGYYSTLQFDSICQADNINKDLKKWRKLKLIDGETGEDVTQYIYIQSLGENEVIYRVQIINSSKMKITKRIRK